jgi:hypothetical protein
MTYLTGDYSIPQAIEVGAIFLIDPAHDDTVQPGKP